MLPVLPVPAGAVPVPIGPTEDVPLPKGALLVDKTGALVAGREVGRFDEPAADEPAPPAPPAPTVTVTVLADVTVTVAGPHVPLPEPPVTGEFPLVGAFALTEEAPLPPYEDPAPAPPAPPAPLEIAPLLVTGRGDTVTVEYMTGAVPVPAGPFEVAFP